MLRIPPICSMRLLKCLAACFLMVAAGSWPVIAGSKTQKKEIAITFDQLPVAVSFAEVDRSAIAERLLGALKKHDVKAAGFVV
ncbi:MAG: polysaccharide deacetylase family protein, partial [Candidatus Zixiibacteriota bacterium]